METRCRENMAEWQLFGVLERSCRVHIDVIEIHDLYRKKAEYKYLYRVSRSSSMLVSHVPVSNFHFQLCYAYRQG